MQGIPVRRVRRQLTREAGAEWMPLPTLTARGMGRNERRKKMRAARRIFKRVGTCPRSKVGQLPGSLQDLWIQQRAAPVMPAGHAQRHAEAFAWLFSIPEIHALAGVE